MTSYVSSIIKHTHIESNRPTPTSSARCFFPVIINYIMSPNTARQQWPFLLLSLPLSLRTYLAAAAGSICAIVYVFYTYSERLNNAKIETAAHHVRIKFSSLKKGPNSQDRPTRTRRFFLTCVCMSTEHYSLLQSAWLVITSAYGVVPRREISANMAAEEPLKK